ncbi:MAG TPA: WYL domain-containing protein [Pontimonas sp.]|nr:WYL domain-containing protein [Pontimonas sp.]
MSKAPASVNPEDRLFHLILALMATRSGLTKEHILSTVRGYREDTESGMARESLERRFERDKDALRELGIPLEATIPPEDDGNNKNTLYRIPKGAYDLPEGVEFTGRDIALLNLAATLWREGTLSKEAHIATRKLQSFGVSIEEPLLGFAPLISTRDPALTSLRDALEHGVQVQFHYLKPGEATATSRQVSPLALVNHEGRWHLYSHETSSDQIKTFLLRRIVSSVTALPDAAVAASETVSSDALSDLEALYHEQVATLRVATDSDAWSALSQRPGTLRTGTTLQVHYTDAEIFAGELSSYGNDVTVMEPADLRERVIGHLRTLVSDHA